MDLLQKTLEDGFMNVGHKIELANRSIQEVGMYVKDLNTRTTLVETRLEERNAAMFLAAAVAPQRITSSPKRGRPRKKPE